MSIGKSYCRKHGFYNGRGECPSCAIRRLTRQEEAAIIKAGRASSKLINKGRLANPDNELIGGYYEKELS